VKSAADIYALYTQRRADRGALLSLMQDVQDHYLGRVVVPLPDMDEHDKPAVANLLAQGLDQTAQRTASNLPNLRCPPTREGVEQARKRADRRRRATLGWWQNSAMNLCLRQRAYWLVGYASTPVILRPDPAKDMIPTWEPRNPLTSFPAPKRNLYDVAVDDCVFAYSRTYGWLRSTYGITMNELYTGRARIADDTQITVLEYADAEETVLAAAGPAAPWIGGGSPDLSFGTHVWSGEGKQIIGAGTASGGAVMLVELERAPNLAEVCPVAVAGRLSLEGIGGQYDQMLGFYEWQAKLMALDLLAQERNVFPSEWITLGTDGNVVRLADGRKGIIGELRGTAKVDVISANPSGQTLQTVNYLERAQRLTGGIPADLGGEGAVNVRTARYGGQLMSAVIDPPIQAYHEVLEHSLEHENRIATHIAKAYSPDRPRSFYVSWRGATGQVDYIPSRDFDSDVTIVSYAIAGADINDLAIAGGQRVGLGTLSRETFMEHDPLVLDPELEKRRITDEALRTAELTALQQSVASGVTSLPDVVRIRQLVRGGMDFDEATLQVHQEAQARQASSGVPGTPEGPVPPGAPEAQPGIAAPGAGEEQPTIPNPPQGLQNLSYLLQNLRSPQRTLPVERQPA
jgi:hypothetical protein